MTKFYVSFGIEFVIEQKEKKNSIEKPNRMMEFYMKCTVDSDFYRAEHLFR